MHSFEDLERINARRTVIIRYSTASGTEMKKVFKGVIALGVVNDFISVVGINCQTFYFQKANVVSIDCCDDGDCVSEVHRREGYVELDLNVLCNNT